VRRSKKKALRARAGGLFLLGITPRRLSWLK